MVMVRTGILAASIQATQGLVKLKFSDNIRTKESSGCISIQIVPKMTRFSALLALHASAPLHAAAMKIAPLARSVLMVNVLLLQPQPIPRSATSQPAQQTSAQKDSQSQADSLRTVQGTRGIVNIAVNNNKVACTLVDSNNYNFSITVPLSDYKKYLLIGSNTISVTGILCIRHRLSVLKREYFTTTCILPSYRGI